MEKTFSQVNEFINDIYGFPFLTDPINGKLTAAETGIREFENAHDIMMDIIKGRRKLVAQEFIKEICPLLEIVVHWNELKRLNRLTSKFLAQCKNKMQNMGNFYGTIHELDMASRCLLSNWDIYFIEDTAKQGKRQIDFVFCLGTKVIGAECMSKRASSLYTPETLTIEKINDDISNHAKKFRPECIANLGIQLNEKVLVIDITQRDYQHPKLLSRLEDTQSQSELDRIIYTWREDFVKERRHSLIAKYKTIGTYDREYFSTTLAIEVFPSAYAFRPYGEPEPRVNAVSEESIKD